MLDAKSLAVATQNTDQLPATPLHGIISTQIIVVAYTFVQTQ